MIINKNYEIKRDKYNFIITEHKYGSNPKTGLPTHSETNKYYPTLELACNYVLSANIKVADMQTIIDTIAEAKSAIVRAIKINGEEIKK